jgi:arylsulfate sulfotransferase
VSEADWLPQTGNVLLTNGGMIRTNEGGQGEGASQGRNWVSLMEVTHSMPAEKVWEIVIDDPSGGWVAYRSQRMPSLYPPSARF